MYDVYVSFESYLIFYFEKFLNNYIGNGDERVISCIFNEEK